MANPGSMKLLPRNSGTRGRPCTSRSIFIRLIRGTIEQIYEDDVLTVETIPLSHKIPCSGFLFREKVKPRRIDKEKLPPGLLLQQIASLKKGEDMRDPEGNIIVQE